VRYDPNLAGVDSGLSITAPSDAEGTPYASFCLPMAP